MTLDQSSSVSTTFVFRELIESYVHKDEKVDMGLPRRCWYQKQDENYEYQPVSIGEEVPREKTANGASFARMPVELRGITLRQLRAVYANIVERCEKEGWVNYKGERLTPETVTLYDVNKYIVLPFTKDSQASFVETLPTTGGTQDPRFFLSHWWGEPFVRTLACLEKFVEDFDWNPSDDDARGGGMTIDTPIWICLFANNQWKLDEAITVDPKESSFTKALQIAKHRLISILDAEGNVFKRVWCNFELYLTFSAQSKENVDAGDQGGMWAVYTSHKPNDAVGIVTGGAPGEFSSVTAERESCFPTELIHMSRNICIESAEASQESDRIHILNSIADSGDLEADSDPPKTHPNYDKVNDAVRGAFASSVPALKAAWEAGGEEWMDTLHRLSRSVKTGTFQLDYISFNDQNGKRLSFSEARELVSHIPVTCNGVFVRHADGEDGEGTIEGLIEWIGKADTIKALYCMNCEVGDAVVGNYETGIDAGIRLAAALAASDHVKSIEELVFMQTNLIGPGNVLEWSLALKKMTALRKLSLDCNSIDAGFLSDFEKNILHYASHASDINIK